MDRISKLKDILQIVILSGAGGFGLLVGWWAQERAVPVRSEFIEVVGHPHPGGKLLVKWHVTRLREFFSTKQEIILDAANVRWSVEKNIFVRPNGPIGEEEFITQTELPDAIPVGPARLRVLLTFGYNPVHIFFPIVPPPMPDINFEITDGDS